jgi:hypothetical protein
MAESKKVPQESSIAAKGGNQEAHLLIGFYEERFKTALPVTLKLLFMPVNTEKMD